MPKPRNYQTEPVIKGCLSKGSVKERSPFTNHTSPSPFKERGIQGERFNLDKANSEFVYVVAHAISTEIGNKLF
jgi:hypothetical protein